MDPIENLSEDPISRLGSLPLNRVAHNATVREAITCMQAGRTGCVLVFDGESLAGIITERDILRHMGTNGNLDIAAEALASKTVWTIPSTGSLADALRLMNHHQCRHLTVVDELNQVIGSLSVRLIVRSLVEHFPSSVYNLPPKANQVQTDREGA